MQDAANVWPQGGLFAFSGIDGDTCHAEPFVASGTPDAVGWDFWLSPRLVVRACLDGSPVAACQSPDDFWLSDCWRGAVRTDGQSGVVQGAFVDRASFTVSLEFEEGAGTPGLVVEPGGRACGDATVCEGERWWAAVCASAPGPVRRFGVAVSYANEEEALARAEAARDADLAGVLGDRLAFHESIEPPDSVWGENRRAYHKAASIMKVNVESAQLDIPCRWTTPDRMPHRHMWLWDSAFHSLGLQHLRQDLAEDAILAVLAKQCDDGRVRLAARPGPAERDETESQPPLLAWAVSCLFDYAGNGDFVERVYPGLVRYVEWFEANRKRENGLYGWFIRAQADPVRGARGGESGMDNSPRFDGVESMTAVDLSSYLAGEYVALEKLARALERPEEARAWRDRRLGIAGLVNELLWDDEDRFYYDLDGEDRFIPIKTVAGLTPLHGRIADRDQAEGLRLHITQNHEFWTAFPVATVSRDEEEFSKDMWRGPAWANLNVLLYHALAAYGFREEAHGLAHKVIAEIARWYVRTGCLYEYYDSLGQDAPADLPRKGAPGPAGGVGFGVIADYNWTAAAYIHLAHQV
ncbi:MAG: hypothetical protein JXR94_21380 [Candidatus Hydrogenedentes bacterium]|nr:hypothetical protein [Candidatus Hydrogenedentota bacterium]